MQPHFLADTAAPKEKKIAKFGQVWAKFGQIWAKFEQNLSEIWSKIWQK